MRRTTKLAGLVLAFLALLGAADWQNLVLAVVVALAVALGGLRHRQPPAEPPLRVAGLPGFLAGSALMLLRASLHMLAVILRPRGRCDPGSVEVPLEELSGRAALLSAGIATAAPGTVLVDIDWQRRQMILNTVDRRQREQVRAQQQRFYRRWQRPLLR